MFLPIAHWFFSKTSDGRLHRKVSTNWVYIFVRSLICNMFIFLFQQIFCVWICVLVVSFSFYVFTSLIQKFLVVLGDLIIRIHPFCYSHSCYIFFATKKTTIVTGVTLQHLTHSILALTIGVGKNMLWTPSATYRRHAFRYMRTSIFYTFPRFDHFIGLNLYPVNWKTQLTDEMGTDTGALYK